MQDNLSELSRKYREEMLRMYGGRKMPAAAEPMAAPEISAAEPEASADMQETVEAPLPMEEEMTAPPVPPSENEEFTGPPDSYQNRIETPVDYEEPALPEYIRNGTPPVMEPDAVREMQDFTDVGNLRVATLTGDGAFPVAGAHVTVSVRRNGADHLAYLLLTDESGETPTVSMPAPPASLSQSPGNAAPFTIVDIRVFAPGFFRAQMLDVPIFAGVTSLQTFQLIPLPIIMHEDMETLSAATESPDL